MPSHDVTRLQSPTTPVVVKPPWRMWLNLPVPNRNNAWWRHQMETFSALRLMAWKKQLNGLANFCSQNLMILKWRRKFSYLEKNQQDSNVKDIHFNGNVIHRSQKYKYLGILLSETQTNQGDIFRYTYEHLCNKARNVLFSIEKKLKHLGVLPPK